MMIKRPGRSEGKDMVEKETRANPVGTTCDLQLVRHATGNCNIGRYRKDLKEIISFNLISNQIGKYQKNLKRNEIKKKRRRRT